MVCEGVPGTGSAFYQVLVQDTTVDIPFSIFTTARKEVVPYSFSAFAILLAPLL